MAWHAGRHQPSDELPRLAPLPRKERGDYPDPQYHYDLESPESGATASARANDVRRDFERRFCSPEDLGHTYHRREGGVRGYDSTRPEDRVTLFELVVSKSKRKHIYSLVGDLTDHDREWIAEAYTDLPSLLIVESQPIRDNVQQDYELFAQIRELYLAHDDVVAGEKQ
jgi:hypothetical protein